MELLTPLIVDVRRVQVVEENETLLMFACFLKKQHHCAPTSMAQQRVARTVAK